ncbi:hypothetical protein L484_019729 [Morus notabilis]|uniref:Uncharacterized protein n=1 Tax=Morus notabilis TaxID=981085 RepID=W9QN39_9ROSA|nr:hypothetical protein L484_019729 [Morus notabilis]
MNNSNMIVARRACSEQDNIATETPHIDFHTTVTRVTTALPQVRTVMLRWPAEDTGGQYADVMASIYADVGCEDGQQYAAGEYEDA